MEMMMRGWGQVLTDDFRYFLCIILVSHDILYLYLSSQVTKIIFSSCSKNCTKLGRFNLMTEVIENESSPFREDEQFNQSQEANKSEDSNLKATKE